MNLKQIRTIRAELRKLGIPEKIYDIVPPFSQKHSISTVLPWHIPDKIIGRNK